MHPPPDTTPVIVEKVFDHPIEKVWRAITDPEHMKQWYFDVPDFIPVAGCAFEFVAGHEDDQWLHACVITDVMPMTKIAYTWRYPPHRGNSLVTWELTDLGQQTRLVLTHSGLETFPPDMEALKKGNFLAGWTGFVNTELYNFLEQH